MVKLSQVQKPSHVVLQEKNQRILEQHKRDNKYNSLSITYYIIKYCSPEGKKSITGAYSQINIYIKLLNYSVLCINNNDYVVNITLDHSTLYTILKYSITDILQ